MYLLVLLKLGGADHRIGPRAHPTMQRTCTQPQAAAVVHQDLDARLPTVGKEVGRVWPRFAENIDDAGQHAYPGVPS